VRITDVTGKLVWKQTATSFPVSWDYTDMDGNAVKPGLYKTFATFSDGSNAGGTPITDLVVLENLKSNK